MARCHDDKSSIVGEQKRTSSGAKHLKPRTYKEIKSEPDYSGIVREDNLQSVYEKCFFKLLSWKYIIFQHETLA